MTGSNRFYIFKSIQYLSSLNSGESLKDLFALFINSAFNNSEGLSPEETAVFHRVVGITGRGAVA